MLTKMIIRYPNITAGACAGISAIIGIVIGGTPGIVVAAILGAISVAWVYGQVPIDGGKF